jgi:PAS domain S-box-containing protein
MALTRPSLFAWSAFIVALVALVLNVLFAFFFVSHQYIGAFVASCAAGTANAPLACGALSFVGIGTGVVAALALLFFAFFARSMCKQRVQAARKDAFSTMTVTREQLEMLYEQSPIPYFLMDEQGNVKSPNKAALRLFGGTREECELVNFFSVITTPRVGGRGEDFSALLRTKVERDIPVVNEDLCVTVQKGGERWVRVSIFSLPRTSDVSLRHIVSLIDITTEREIEQTKTDFLLLASHQLRTPTTAIKWHVDYLRSLGQEEVGQRARAYLDEIYAGNERMMDLIRTLLTVSRIEMGVLEPEYVPVRYKALIEDVLAELAPNIEKRAMHVAVEVEGDDRVTTDNMMLRIAVHNLLTNAIKYTPREGNVYITLSCEAHRCTFSVRDTGKGIPAAEQNQIFAKMFRATNARKMTTQGTGLGLYLTKAFIEKLGGSISFVSAEGRGTTFTIELPRVAPGA